jgi:hypothetical protein
MYTSDNDITDYFSKSVSATKERKLGYSPQIINLSFPDMLHHLCFNIKQNDIILDYKYFKLCAFPETYDILIKYVIDIIKSTVTNYSEFILHINMKSLSLSDIDKYYSFIQSISETMKQIFPNKLSKCYVYNAPFIFSQLFNTLSCFIDKKTQQKIVLK